MDNVRIKPTLKNQGRDSTFHILEIENLFKNYIKKPNIMNKLSIELKPLITNLFSHKVEEIFGKMKQNVTYKNEKDQKFKDAQDLKSKKHDDFIQKNYIFIKDKLDKLSLTKKSSQYTDLINQIKKAYEKIDKHGFPGENSVHKFLELICNADLKSYEFDEKYIPVGYIELTLQNTLSTLSTINRVVTGTSSYYESGKYLVFITDNAKLSIYGKKTHNYRDRNVATRYLIDEVYLKNGKSYNEYIEAKRNVDEYKANMLSGESYKNKKIDEVQLKKWEKIISNAEENSNFGKLTEHQVFAIASFDYKNFEFKNEKNFTEFVAVPSNATDVNSGGRYTRRKGKSSSYLKKKTKRRNI